MRLNGVCDCIYTRGVNDRRSRRILLVISSVLLWGVGLLYLGVGLYRLVLSDAYPFAHDLSLRWDEMRAVVGGVAPSTLYKTDYPPWAYGWGLVLVPPVLSWSMARIYFGVLSGTAIAVTAIWAYRSQKDRIWGAMASGVAVAMIAVLYCLSNGQYTIIVAAALVLMLCCLQRNMQVLAGILASLAFVKPHISALFLLILLFRRQWLAILSFAICTALMTVITSAMTSTGPITLIEHMFVGSGQFVSQDQGLAALLGKVGLGDTMWTLLTMGMGGLVASVLFWRHKRSDLLTLFAIASVISMLWSYHKAYDEVLSVFLVVACFSAVVKKRDPFNRACLLALILLQLLPFRMTDYNLPWLQVAGIAVRIAAMIAVLRQTTQCAEVRVGRKA